jgi:hypothetical protein
LDNLDIFEQSAARGANAEFSDLIGSIFSNHSTISRIELATRIFEWCPRLYEWRSQFNIGFEGDHITVGEFITFFCHFGPTDSLMAKHGQFIEAKAVWRTFEVCGGSEKREKAPLLQDEYYVQSAR